MHQVGSLLSAAAVNSYMFIVGRAVAGTGAAGILQGALSVIGHTVELEKRPMYMGIVISVFVISVCIGPVLGGVFTTRSSWRWAFYINLPLGAVTLVLLFLFLKIKGSENKHRRLPLKQKLEHMDPLGCLIFISTITCVLIALQWGGQSKPWNSSTIIGLLVGFGLLSCLFVYVQWRRGDKAMIPLRVLRQRSIYTSAGVLFFLGASTYIHTFYLPFYFQAVQGVDAITSGIRFIALMLPQMVALIGAGAIVSKWGHYVPLMIVGEIVCIVGTALLTRLELGTSTAIWATFLVVTGIGMGIAMQLPYTAIQVAIPETDVPTANAIAVFSWQLGGAIAIAAGQTITISTIVKEVPKQLPAMSVVTVLAAGAANLSEFATSAAALNTLRLIWNTAVNRTLLLSLATVCAAIPFTLGMEWLNAKAIAKSRKELEENLQSEKIDADTEPISENGKETSTVKVTV
ncbi:MAG: hypothetical protein Q9187_001384 [Circinaria calcarea]